MKRLLIFSIFLVLFSCSKDQENTVLPASGTLLRYVKSSSGSVQSEFIYDNAGKITSRNTYSADKLLGEASIHYKNGKAHLTDQKMDISSSTTGVHYIYSRSEFVYNGKQIIQNNHFLKESEHATPVLRSFTVFEYNAAGFIVKETRFLDDGTPLSYTKYSHDLSGNITLSENYERNTAGEMQLIQKTSYQHDQNMNPYLTVYLPVENIPFSVNKNNITHTTVTNYTQDVTNVSVTQYGNFTQRQLPQYMIENNDNSFLFEYN